MTKAYLSPWGRKAVIKFIQTPLMSAESRALLAKIITQAKMEKNNDLQGR
jgi:hypothetical protein